MGRRAQGGTGEVLKIRSDRIQAKTTLEASRRGGFIIFFNFLEFLKLMHLHKGEITVYQHWCIRKEPTLNEGG